MQWLQTNQARGFMPEYLQEGHAIAGHNTVNKLPLRTEKGTQMVVPQEPYRVLQATTSEKRSKVTR